jgi:hypothetical protein
LATAGCLEEGPVGRYRPRVVGAAPPQLHASLERNEVSRSPSGRLCVLRLEPALLSSPDVG